MESRPHCTPFFLDGHRGRLFAVHHGPSDLAAARAQVLVVLPFNEEMNRCRSMVTMQARALATHGIGTLVVDPYGTGDSEGEHLDARLDLWLDDFQLAADWLDRQPGGCRAILGIRFGAILAVQLQTRRKSPSTLILWQPVSDGKTHLTQFMRVKIAAQLDRPDLPKETTATMRAALAAGEPIEVAGYALHPEFTAAMESLRLDALAPEPGASVLWLENASGDPPEIPPASRTLLQRWPGEGRLLEARGFVGPAFWQVHERAVAPDFIERGTEWLRRVVLRT
ncbi:MAG: hypothetical protein AMXMBFR78_02900 [Rubrivivax sp.]